MRNQNKKVNITIISIITVASIVFLVSSLVFGVFNGINDNKKLPTLQTTPEDLTVSDQPDPDLALESSVESSEVSEGFEKTDIVKKPAVKLMMVGDNLLHLPLVYSAKKEDGSYNFDHIFKNVLPYIEDADLAMINQETMLAGESLGYSGYPQFNSPTEVADAISKAGFNVVTHANNHALDKGYEGVRLTIENWERFPQITLLGINKNNEQYEKVEIVEINGIKIALLSYTFSTNGINLPKDMPWLVDTTYTDKVKKDLAFANENADFVIVMPHWGDEYVYEPNSLQNDLTKLYLEYNVDLVIGSHPHVIQPVEWLEKEDGHKMLVYYSLGNYISTQNRPPRMLGGMATLNIEQNEDGTIEIVDPKFVPLGYPL